MPRHEAETFLETLPAPEDEGVSRLWAHFAEISSIPRPSGSETLIGQYIVEIAETQGLEHEVDEVGNVLIRLPATPGYEDAPGLLFQGHSDMIAVAATDASVNPETEGVIPIIEEGNEWITADRTTLGADNGIGLAAMMSILEEDVPHGPLGLLITADEERGLLGAKKVSFNLEQYSYLVNLDSEDVSEVVIGCAGGEDTVLNLPINKEPLSLNSSLVSLSIDGLKGGHSGIDIGLVGTERANAIKFVTEVLLEAKQTVDFQIVKISGGTKRNLIPSHAEVILAVTDDDFDLARAILEQLSRNLIGVYPGEDSAEISVERALKEDNEILSPESTDLALEVLRDLPNGVQLWNEDMPGLIDTSTNLAIIKTSPSAMSIRFMSRSVSAERLDALKNDIVKVDLKGRFVTALHEGGYPGWEPQPESPLVELIQEVNVDLTGQLLGITATHGGLECGLLSDKYPHLQMVSIGPTIEGAHTVQERVNIESVSQFYSLVKSVVEAVAEQSE